MEIEKNTLLVLSKLINSVEKELEKFMSNILNLKGVKFFAIVLVAVAVLATFGMVAVQSASADCTITTTLRVGSTGTEVVCLQGKIGATADGKFGPMTAAAVKAFQASKGLSADGVVGPMTRAALMGAVSGNFPAGCTSAAGYSMTTGIKCDTGASAGLPAGCSSTAGYSVLTGTKCDSTSTGGTTSSGPLAGGVGDITVTELSSPSASTKVAEGESDMKVLGIEVEADNGSDIQISSMKVTFEHTSGSGNDKFDRYAEEVSIFMGSTKVGSADVSDFSESSGVYSKTINLSNAIVRADDTENFYVTVDAINDIDSGNTGSSNNTWTATLSSTRFMDATGAILTDSTGSIANTFVFDTLSNTGDIELKVALASNTPDAATVKVSTTADTNQVELLKFTLKAQNSAMTVDQIPVLFTGSETDLDQVTSNVTLVIDGKTFNEAVVTSAAATATVDFDNLDLRLDANETVTGTIYADILDIETSTFDEGTTLYASIAGITTIGSGTAALDVEDSNGDQLASGDRSGSAVGKTMTFRSEGVNVVMGTPTEGTPTTDTNGAVTSVTYFIPLAVTSFGDTLFIGQSAQLATAASASNAFALVMETAAAPNSESVSATTDITFSTSNATIESNGYRLDDGQTKNFTIKVTLLAATTNASHRFRVDTVRTFTEAGLVTATNSNLLPVENYRTGFQFINN